MPEEFDSDDDNHVLEQIRRKYLKMSTVPIVLLGARTWSLKWVDWEIYASLRPYGNRPANGLLAIISHGHGMAGKTAGQLSEEIRTLQTRMGARSVGPVRICAFCKLVRRGAAA